VSLATLDPAISALTYRVSQTERKIEEVELLIGQTSESLRNLRHELAAGRVMIKAENEKSSRAVMAGVLDERDICVPEELKIKPARRVRGKRKSGGGNRTATITAKRWALWRLQREQGYTFQQIARAWRCNHATIVSASNNGFIPYRKNGKAKR